MKMHNNLLKRTISLVLCLSMLLSWAVFGVSAEEDYSGELLVNPGFETGNTNGWSFYGGGKQTNNPHKPSTYGFYLNANPAYYVKQAITAPYTGLYKGSVYINLAGTGATFGIREVGGKTLMQMDLPTGLTYASPQVLDPVLVTQGTQLEIYVTGNTSWVNGDDFSLTYDFSNVFQNLLYGQDLSEEMSIRAPWAGPYILTATVTAGEEDAVVALGEHTVTVAAGETKEVEIVSDEMELNEIIKVSIGGTVSDAQLVFDVSSIPNEAPTADDVKASGILFAKEQLTGSYSFSDPDEDQKEGSSTYRWLQADTADGEFEPIEGAVGANYILTDEQNEKYIQFEVTPVDSYGKAGESICSEAVGPVRINYVGNPGMEQENNGSSLGWSGENGGGVYNKQTHSGGCYEGFKFGYIGAADADASVFYGLTVPITGKFTLQAYVKTTKEGGSLGVRFKGSKTAYAAVELPNTEGQFQQVTLRDIAIENDTDIEVYVAGASDSSAISADYFALWFQGADDMPTFTTLKSFEVEGAVVVNKNVDKKTIDVTVPYGTDLTAVTVNSVVSEGAQIVPASGSKVDFTDSVEFVITNGDQEAVWTVSVKEGRKVVTITSDNETLEDGFNWAANKTEQFVMTGKTGKVTPPSNYPHGYDDLNNVEYIPSYWAGYYNRTAFYARDFVHQAVGAQVVGLAEENFSMFKAYAESCTEEGGWWTQWALNFDGKTPYSADWWSATNFLHELPAQFELVEKAYQQYLWSGDDRYITDEALWDMYTHIMIDFVASHDSNGNGIAEAIDPEGFKSSVLMCSYNERSGRPLLESGDAFGAQYQATLAYAAMLKYRGEEEASAQWYEKAADMLNYFNNEWSIKTGDESGNYVHSVGKNGVQYNDFSKETSWFMPMKQLLQDNDRAQAYLTFIAEAVGDGIGDTAYSPANIEAWSYLPDVFFPYNRNEEAWKVMKYIYSIIDEPHEISSQGTNGDYPEISFTFVSSTIAGMMGVEPIAADHFVATASRLPEEVGYAKADYIQVGEHELSLEHDGLTKSVMTNTAEHDLTWEARFYGDYPCVKLDGKLLDAQQKQINGVTVSYVVVPVEANETVTATAIPAENVLEEMKLAAAQELEEAREAYDETLYAEAGITALDDALQTGLAAVEAAENKDAVVEAVEAAKKAMDAVAMDNKKLTKQAEVAKQAAEKAQAAAEEAQAKAEAAQAAADTARADAEVARNAALKAEENAGKDASAAADAKAAADAAQAKAETAQRAAETAQAEAEAAQDKAEIAQTAAEAAAKAAEENNAAAAAEAAQAAKEAANAAEEALKSATSATESAASAAESASFAAKAAESAKDAQIAQKAAEEAQAKAEQAQKAAEEAQKAAEKAALDGAKYQAALNLDTYVNLVDQSEYDAKQVEALAQIVSDAKAEIDEAETTEEIDTILSETKLAIYAMDDVCPSKSYTDVAKNAWYHDYVDFMVENGYMNGVSNTLFDADGSVTRAQLVTILYRVAGEPSVEGLNNPFTDVAEGKWYTDAILWAAENGIVKGVSATEFAPDKEITREQIVTIVYRYDGEVEVAEEHLSAFHDTDKIANFAKAAMNWAVAKEIMNGVTETTLAPDATATRAQICAIVMRYLEN